MDAPIQTTTTVIVGEAGVMPWENSVAIAPAK
jgi:hypothetical protein